MKIDISQEPPIDIFKDQRKLIIVFSILIGLACVGILIGAYAILSNSANASLETWALVFFVAPAPFATFFGEKLQKYKRLTPPQVQKLSLISDEYTEVQTYLDAVKQLNRRLTRVEYQACVDWVEDLGEAVPKNGPSKGLTDD